MTCSRRSALRLIGGGLVACAGLVSTEANASLENKVKAIERFVKKYSTSVEKREYNLGYRDYSTKAHVLDMGALQIVAHDEGIDFLVEGNKSNTFIYDSKKNGYGRFDNLTVFKGDATREDMLFLEMEAYTHPIVLNQKFAPSGDSRKVVKRDPSRESKMWLFDHRNKTITENFPQEETEPLDEMYSAIVDHIYHKITNRKYRKV